MNPFRSRFLWYRPALVLLVYGISFYVPAADLRGYETDARGRRLSRSGASGFTMSLHGDSCFTLALKMGRPSWWANPALWLGCLLLAIRQWPWAALAGFVALALALTECVPTFLWRPPEDQASYLPGYWLWLASAVLLLAIGWTGWVRTRYDDLLAEDAVLPRTLP